MSYKNAIAGLPFGGGKAVLQKPSGAFDRRRFFAALADVMAQLKGRYIIAEDVGTFPEDMAVVRERTPYVAGREGPTRMTDGDPSPWTTFGVFLSMREGAQVALGADLPDLTVAIQGLGMWDSLSNKFRRGCAT